VLQKDIVADIKKIITGRKTMGKESKYTVEDTSRAKLQAKPEAVAAFMESGFGLSIHWGLYSINGRGEWVMHTESIPFDTYKKRMKEFNPVRFNAEEWADLMLESGQKFMIITSKHHDGFSMFDTALRDFKITNTQFKRDVLAELAKAFADRGLKLCFYYSLLDWSHPAYRNDWPAYIEFYQGQLKELLTNYGKISGIIFDGYWPRFQVDDKTKHFLPGGEWDLAGTYDLIHKIQPETVVINNTHVLPLKGEDIQVWELDMPGENTIGFNTTEVGDRPAAVWWNLNRGWAYAPRVHHVKPADEIFNAMLKAYGRGAVFMLNVGPRPFGDIHPDEQRVLREIGSTIRKYGVQLKPAKK